MPLVDIAVRVEENHAIPAMRSIKGIAGVVEVRCNWDEVTAPKKPPQRITEINGAKMTLPQLLISILASKGPQHLAVLGQYAQAAKFGTTSIHSALNTLRRAGETESGGVGIHQLTAAAREKYSASYGANADAEAPLALLPAPKSDKAKKTEPPRTGKKGIFILRLLQSAEGPLAKSYVNEQAKAAGIVQRTVEGSVYTFRKKYGYLKPDGTSKKGHYELTAKGRQLSLPALPA